MLVNLLYEVTSSQPDTKSEVKSDTAKQNTVTETRKEARAGVFTCFRGT